MVGVVSGCVTKSRMTGFINIQTGQSFSTIEAPSEALDAFSACHAAWAKVESGEVDESAALAIEAAEYETQGILQGLLITSRYTDSDPE